MRRAIRVIGYMALLLTVGALSLTLLGGALHVIGAVASRVIPLGGMEPMAAGAFLLALVIPVGLMGWIVCAFICDWWGS